MVSQQFDTAFSSSTVSAASLRVSAIRSRGQVCGLRTAVYRMEPSPLWLSEMLQAGATVDPLLHRWLVAEVSLRARAASLREATQPLTIEPRLLPFQAAGVRFLSEMQRTLLFDEMGLGKTVEALVACRATDARRVLVVAPKFLGAKWEREVRQWWPDAVPVRQGICEAPEPNVVITNWDALRTKKGAWVFERTWDWFIGDEAQAIKNRRAQRTRAAAGIKARYVALLSGTPADRAPHEIWTLLHLLHPDRFTSYWRFLELFVTTDWYSGQPRGPRRENLPYLHDLVAPWYLRRTREVLGLAPPFEVPVAVEMPAAQAALYRQVARGIVLELAGNREVVLVNAVARLVRLRQVSVSPALLDPEVTASGKITAFVELCQTYNEPIVAVCNFRKGVELAQHALSTGGVTAAFIHGGLAARVIDATVQSFRQGDFQVLVMTPIVGGLGHNMETARILVFIDRPWSLVQIEQVMGRVARFGQTQHVVVHVLVNSGTVDEKVEALYTQKRENFTATFIASFLLSCLNFPG